MCGNLMFKLFVTAGNMAQLQTQGPAGYQWLMPVIPASWENEIKKVTVQGQPGQIVHDTPSLK
jgi:hypothetical protein